MGITRSMWRTAHAAAALAASQAQAQQNLPEFHVAAGSLDEALRAYARFTGLQMLYRPEDVDGISFGGLDGRMSREDALRRILAGTPLVAERPSGNVVVLRPGRSAAGAVEEAASAPDIVVTGSNIRGGSPTTPIKVITREDVERSGRATVAEVIAAQTANFGGTGNPTASLTGTDRSSANASLAPAANLRGLGSDATLTLFDGRRVAGSGGRGNFSDLSALPSLALERVEILADGASAIYGSDAVGGVVNLILRHRYDGFEMRVRGGQTKGGPSSALLGAVGGRTWSGGSVLVAYDYEHRDALAASDRAYTATGDLRPFGGTDHRSFLSTPGTILRLDAASRSYVPFLAIPVLPAGVRPTGGDLNAGVNLSNLAAGVSLSPRIDRHSVYGRAEQELTSNLRAFTDVRFARRDFAYGAPAAQTILAITPANPNFISLPGQPVSVIGYSFLADLGPSRASGQVSSLSASAGATWSVGRWILDGYGTFARERSSERIVNQLNATALAEALGNLPNNPSTSYDPARDGYFDPYGSGSANGDEVLRFVGSGFVAARRRSSVAEGLVKAEGPVTSLPGGEVRLAIGGSFRRETLRTGGTTFSSGIEPTELAVRSLDRDVRAIFAEARLPLVGSGNAVPGLASLQISAAVRHEDHDGFGGTTDPRLGLAASPAAGITVRGSWGTSFRAPALPEAGEPRRIAATSLRDAGGATVPVIFVAGGNPDLGPERADTVSFGFDVDGGPTGAPGLTTSLTVFRTRFEDRISQPALQDTARALTNPDLAPFVQRVSPLTDAADLAAVNALLAEPGGSGGLFPATSYVAIVDGRNVNTGSVLVSGIDWDLGYAFTTGLGRFSASLNSTWLFRYVERLTPVARPSDRLGRLGRPSDMRVRGGLGWSKDGWNANAFANFVDGYLDDASAPVRAISSFLTVDLSLGYSVGSGILKGFRMLLSAENALDADPPFVDRANGFGFDAANANPFGRTLAFELRRAF